VSASGAAELVLAVLALAATALALTAVLQVRGTHARVLAILILCAVTAVGELEALSLVGLLTATALLFGGLIMLIAAAGLWWSYGRPALLEPGRPPLAEVWRALRSRPALSVLLAVAAGALSLQAVMAVTVAPNEADSLGYHLPRAASWLQHRSVLQFQGGQLDDPELAAPPNAEMLLAWTMALTRSDRVTQLVQWWALISAALAVFGTARLIGSRPAESAWAAGLFVLMPEVLLQGATDQNDSCAHGAAARAMHARPTAWEVGTRARTRRDHCEAAAPPVGTSTPSRAPVLLA